MFENIENLKIISSLNRINRPDFKVENRATHSFFFRVRGSIRYDFGDLQFLVHEGQIMFVPKGSTYRGTTLSPNTQYVSINFDADFSVPPQPFCCGMEDFYQAEYIRSRFSDMWNLGSATERYRCIALVYDLLAYLSNLESTTYAEKHKFPIIEPATVYLRDHIYDTDLRTDHLHRLCGISNTYFRQIFASRYGTTPQNYITSKRLSHARAILGSGDFHTIAEVALSVGFRDPLYFSKVFKKTYGFSPSDANQK